jgi:hypothetical protein
MGLIIISLPDLEKERLLQELIFASISGLWCMQKSLSYSFPPYMVIQDRCCAAVPNTCLTPMIFDSASCVAQLILWRKKTSDFDKLISWSDASSYVLSISINFLVSDRLDLQKRKQSLAKSKWNTISAPLHIFTPWISSLATAFLIREVRPSATNIKM